MLILGIMDKAEEIKWSLLANDTSVYIDNSKKHIKIFLELLNFKRLLFKELHRTIIVLSCTSNKLLEFGNLTYYL